MMKSFWMGGSQPNGSERYFLVTMTHSSCYQAEDNLLADQIGRMDKFVISSEQGTQIQLRDVAFYVDLSEREIEVESWFERVAIS